MHTVTIEKSRLYRDLNKSSLTTVVSTKEGTYRLFPPLREAENTCRRSQLERNRNARCGTRYMENEGNLWRFFPWPDCRYEIYYTFMTTLLLFGKWALYFMYIYIYTGCPRRNVPDFGRMFLMLKYTHITQNTYFKSWTVTEIMASEVWNFDSCYSLIDYQIHIETGRNMWFL